MKLTSKFQTISVFGPYDPSQKVLHTAYGDNAVTEEFNSFAEREVNVLGSRVEMAQDSLYDADRQYHKKGKEPAVKKHFVKQDDFTFDR